MYKASIKEAARRVRDEVSFLGNSADASPRSVLAATSRAFWFNKLALAKKIIGSINIGADLLYIDGGKVRLKDLVYFNDSVNETNALCQPTN